MIKETRLLGLTFIKMNVEKNPDFQGKVEINSNMDVSKVEKHKQTLLKQDTAKINFKFSISYGDLGKIDLEGFMVWLFDKKTLKEVLEGWNKNELEQEIRTSVLNVVLQKCSLQALKLEEQFNLPLHMQMPSVKVNTESK